MKKKKAEDLGKSQDVTEKKKEDDLGKSQDVTEKKKEDDLGEKPNDEIQVEEKEW